jgi:hypothetical protein
MKDDREIDQEAREQLVSLAYQVNSGALAGRNPRTVSDHELAQAILAVIPEHKKIIPIGAGKPYTCKRCGALLGHVIEHIEDGRTVKALLSTGVVVGPKQPWHCIKCGGKVYFTGVDKKLAGGL